MRGAVLTDERVGTELAGYRIEALLGRGGMGVVYLARDPWLQRQVALKLITPERAEHSGFRERSLRESRLAASLEHAHVIAIYEAGEADGALYLAMRYAEGTDLGALLEEQRALPPAQALAILEPVAVALDAAHTKGLVHRDVKPGNILIAPGPEPSRPESVYLSDFGLTKHAHDEVGLTGAEDVIGTLAYVAPEQIEGETVGSEADIYSLGCVLHECLAGIVPFATDSKMQLLWAHLEQPPPVPSAENPTLPEAIDGVIARALAKAPAERFSSCGELTAAAWLALAGEGRAASLADETCAALPAQIDRNPYKGLRAFGEADADDFFGRDTLVEELLDRLAGGERLLAVVGPSGSGKSSVVAAGLLPLIRDGGISGSEAWPVVEIVPGSHPVEELAAALMRVPATQSADTLVDLDTHPLGLVRAAQRILDGLPGSELLLVVDQFEELFTVADDERRLKFVELLTNAVHAAGSRVRVVLTLRADFYDRPLRVRGLSELVESGHVAVHPLAPAELEQAIVGPAEWVGLRLEPGLVADIVGDVIDQPGALPLLQHAMAELFERRDDATLTREAYQAISGVSGALANRAEELFVELDGNAQGAARRLFTRLVVLGEGTEDTRGGSSAPRSQRSRRVRAQPISSSMPTVASGSSRSIATR